MVDEYVAERGATTEVVDVEVEVDDGVAEVDVVVASSIGAPLVNPFAKRLAEHLSSPVELRLLVVDSDTKRATVTP